MFLSYVLSFVYVGIYWNNHHHLLHAAQRVNGGVLWANLHLLFWLSLVPFATGVDGREPLRAAADAPSTASSCWWRRSRTTILQRADHRAARPDVARWPRRSAAT